jgi:hypothetical protein
MSRDQRPGRVVMVDTDPVSPVTERRAVDQLGILLWVMLFLLACAAGAGGFSLMARSGVL